MGYIIKYDEISKLYDILTFRNIFILEKLNKIEDSMKQFINSNSFSGKYVFKIKSLFNNVQMPIIEAIDKVYSSFPSYYILYLGELMAIESNPEAILNEELLTELTGELQKALDYIDTITYNTNLQIDSITDFADIDRISPTVFKVNGFGFVKEKIDTLLQGVADIESSFYNTELYKLDDLLDALKTVLNKMPQSGNINILEDELDKLFPLDEIGDLRDITNDINIDDKKEYIDYIRRLCDANDDYDIKDKYTLDLVMKILNASRLSKENIAIAAELAEFYFWFCEFCGEKYLYEWTDTEMLDWLYWYIPNHVSDETVIYIMTLMSTPLDNATMELHLQHNRELWLKYLKEGKVDINGNGIFEDGYIENQALLYELYYGVDDGPMSASNNTCGVIALYNALYSLNGGVSSPKYDFPELIAQMEGRGPCLNGMLGTSPVIIEEYLKDEGYDVRMLEGNDARDASSLEELQDDYDTYIVTVYNNENDISSCVHFMCITTVEIEGETKYILRNDSMVGTLPKDSISDCLEIYSGGDSKTICIMGISN